MNYQRIFAILIMMIPIQISSQEAKEDYTFRAWGPSSWYELVRPEDMNPPNPVGVRAKLIFQNDTMQEIGEHVDVLRFTDKKGTLEIKLILTVNQDIIPDDLYIIVPDGYYALPEFVIVKDDKKPVEILIMEGGVG